MTDVYINYDDLKNEESENKDYKICAQDIGASITIIAPHGGSIEKGTSEITKHLATDEFNYYSFEGIKQQHNRDLHITSTNFDEPQCIDLVSRSNMVVAIHGKRGNGNGIFMGGKDTVLKDFICEALVHAGFNAHNETNINLSAISSNNICNKGPSGKGVQLEIHKGLRNELRENSDLMNSFCSAIRSAIISKQNL